MVNLMKEFWQLAKTKKGLPENLRLYFIYKDAHHYISNGIIKEGFKNFDIKDRHHIDRDFLLSIYEKMEFIFDELIRLLLLGYENNEKSRRLLYILSIVPMNRKIRLFLDWKIFDEEFTRSLSRLFEVKNSISHSVHLDEVEYRQKTILFLSNKKDLKQFKNDLQSAWDELLQVYVNELEKIDWEKLIQKIKK